MKCLFLSGLRFIKGPLGIHRGLLGFFYGGIGSLLGVHCGVLRAPLGSIWGWPVLTSGGKRPLEECTILTTKDASSKSSTEVNKIRSLLKVR